MPIKFGTVTSPLAIVRITELPASVTEPTGGSTSNTVPCG